MIKNKKYQSKNSKTNKYHQYHLVSWRQINLYLSLGFLLCKSIIFHSSREYPTEIFCFQKKPITNKSVWQPNSSILDLANNNAFGNEHHLECCCHKQRKFFLVDC